MGNLEQAINANAEKLKGQLTKDQLAEASEALQNDPNTLPMGIKKALSDIKSEAGITDEAWREQGKQIATEFMGKLLAQTDEGVSQDGLMNQEASGVKNKLLNHPKLKSFIAKVTQYMSWPEFTALVFGLFKIDSTKGTGAVLAKLLGVNEKPAETPAPVATDHPAENVTTPEAKLEQEYGVMLNKYNLASAENVDRATDIGILISNGVIPQIDDKGKERDEVTKLMEQAFGANGKVRKLRDSFAQNIPGKTLRFRFADLKFEKMTDAQIKKMTDLLDKKGEKLDTPEKIRVFLDQAIINTDKAIAEYTTA